MKYDWIVSTKIVIKIFVHITHTHTRYESQNPSVWIRGKVLLGAPACCLTQELLLLADKSRRVTSQDRKKLLDKRGVKILFDENFKLKMNSY